MTTCDRRTLNTLRARIKAKTCTPIISNRLYFPKARQLLKAWAKDIEYPYPVEQHTSLAAVAQYLSVIRNPIDAREQFIQFAKEQLLDEARVLAETDTHLQGIIDDVADQLEQRSLSEIARMLKYPFEPSAQRAVEILASFRLPVYITTSYYNFLEQVLAEGEKLSPRTEIGIWLDDMQQVPSII